MVKGSGVSSAREIGHAVHRELKSLGRIIETTATQVEDAHIKIAVLTGEVEALRQEVRTIAAKL